MERFFDANPLAAQAVMAFAAVLTIVALWPKRKHQRRSRMTGLDTPLYWWNKKDCFTIRDLIAGGAVCFGRAGAGKTSAMKSIAKAILRHGNSSMLVMCGKQGEAQEWVEYAKECGREKDVVLFGVNHPARFNMVGWAADRGSVDCVAQVVRLFTEMRCIILRETELSGGDAMYWRKQDERAIAHAVQVLHLAGEPITPQSIHDVIMTAPTAEEDLDSEDWRAKACNRALAAAHCAQKSPIQEHDFNLAYDYLIREWPSMADRTRASILVGTIGTLTAMNTGICRELFANYSNITPKDAIEGRKIVIIDLPPDEMGRDLGLVANCGWKFHYQREVLTRQITDESPIACIWGDEASMWIAPSDTAFLSRCRSYKACMVYICQSLEAFREVMPGDKGHSGVEAMLANFSHRLIFSLGDNTTATWAADLIGKQLQMYGGGGSQYGEHKPFVYTPRQFSASYSEHMDYVVQPSRFMNGFRTGGPRNNFAVDALLIRSGEPFSNGLPILKVAFDQRT